MFTIGGARAKVKAIAEKDGDLSKNSGTSRSRMRRLIGSSSSLHGIQQKQQAPNHDRRIGHVEVRPMIMDDMDFGEKSTTKPKRQRSYALPRAPPRIRARASPVALSLRPQLE